MSDEGELHHDLPSLLGSGHWVWKLAIGLVDHGDRSVGTTPMRESLCAPGTDRIRTGALATMVDLVAGHAPKCAHGPTVDLRVEIFAPPPTTGGIRLTARPLRVGRRLIVADTMITAVANGVPFARATTTFMNNELPVSYRVADPPVTELGAPSPDEFVAATRRTDGSFELYPEARIANGPQGTIQGGVQALLAEIAADHALADVAGTADRRSAAVDLDIRYLGRLPVGPLVATPTVLAHDDDGGRVTVLLTDGGNGDSIVAFVSLTMRFCDRPVG